MSTWEKIIVTHQLKRNFKSIFISKVTGYSAYSSVQLTVFIFVLIYIPEKI